MNILTIVIVLAVILVSMVLHELAHGVVAYWLGDDTAKEDGRLTLNPLKHLDPVLSVAMPVMLLLAGGPVFGGAKPVPVDSSKLKHGPYGMALVALAGPLTNFLLAFITFLIGHFTGLLYDAGTAGFVCLEMIMVNLGFGVFNLLPVPPLDGSRILYAIAPNGVREVLTKIEPYGMIVVLVLVVVFSGVISQLMTTAIQGIMTGFYFLVGVKL